MVLLVQSLKLECCHATFCQCAHTKKIIQFLGWYHFLANKINNICNLHIIQICQTLKWLAGVNVLVPTLKRVLNNNSNTAAQMYCIKSTSFIYHKHLHIMLEKPYIHSASVFHSFFTYCPLNILVLSPTHYYQLARLTFYAENQVNGGKRF